MSHVKDGYGPQTPQFFAFHVTDATHSLSDARPTNKLAKSPRKPAKLHSNADTRVSGSPTGPTSSNATQRSRKPRSRGSNTMDNRRNGGGGMYWSPLKEGMAG